MQKQEKEKKRPARSVQKPPLRIQRDAFTLNAAYTKTQE
jgi:hypothetical protein